MSLIEYCFELGRIKKIKPDVLSCDLPTVLFSLHFSNPHPATHFFKFLNLAVYNIYGQETCLKLRVGVAAPDNEEEGLKI